MKLKDWWGAQTNQKDEYVRLHDASSIWRSETPVPDIKGTVVATRELRRRTPFNKWKVVEGSEHILR